MVATVLHELFESAATVSMSDIENIPDFRQQYLSHSDINDYLDSLQAKYPHLVRVENIGQSFEKRELKSILISTTVKLKIRKTKTASICRNSKSMRNSSAAISKRIREVTTHRKQVILIDAGMHAREWCTISTALHCISQLIDNFDHNKHLLDAFDFVIVPIVNADGYEYSREFNKMWRKSRRPISSSSKFVGVDCNRNFSVGWESANAKESSCTYRGEKPFSEPETRIVKHLMHTLKPTFYLTLHSFSKSIMFPYAFSNSLPGNWLNMHNLARAGYLAIEKATGTKFRVGSVSSLVKNAKRSGGGSLDYAYRTAKIPFVIAMELSGGSFHPPAKKIHDIACESWIGIRAMCSFLRKKFNDQF